MPTLIPNIQQRSLSVEPRCRGFGWSRMQFPLSDDMLLARDSIVGISIPSSISLPASLFTHSVIQDPMTNSLATLLASSLWCCITERVQRYLSVTRSDKSQSRSMPTQQTPSEIPVEHLYDHPVMKWRLIAHKVFLRYPGVAWSHGLRNRYLTLRKLWQSELSDTIIC